MIHDNMIPPETASEHNVITASYSRYRKSNRMFGQSLQSQPQAKRLQVNTAPKIGHFALFFIPVDDFRTSWITERRPRRNAFRRNVMNLRCSYRKERNSVADEVGKILSSLGAHVTFSVEFPFAENATSCVIAAVHFASHVICEHYHSCPHTIFQHPSWNSWLRATTTASLVACIRRSSSASRWHGYPSSAACSGTPVPHRVYN